MARRRTVDGQHEEEGAESHDPANSLGDPALVGPVRVDGPPRVQREEAEGEQLRRSEPVDARLLHQVVQNRLADRQVSQTNVRKCSEEARGQRHQEHLIHLNAPQTQDGGGRPRRGGAGKRMGKGWW